jgi:hypothetical protein
MFIPENRGREKVTETLKKESRNGVLEPEPVSGGNRGAGWRSGAQARLQATGTAFRTKGNFRRNSPGSPIGHAIRKDRRKVFGAPFFKKAQFEAL